MKIVRAKPARDLQAKPGGGILHHPPHAGPTPAPGRERWIPDVTWVELHKHRRGEMGKKTEGGPPTDDEPPQD
jgi:hypothetical protein